ncbi:hypothetical protein [Nocardia sp. NPDC057455]|uniref:hypothetical protein n=1 Tax=Nocardia sp. NPDC057455 TaxID=3346138 RepID=UPI0036715E30
MSFADDIPKPATGGTETSARTEYDGHAGFLQTGALAGPPASFTELLRQFGYDPNEVQIVGHPRISRWQSYGGEWLEAYRFHIAPRLADITDETIGRWRDSLIVNPAPAASVGQGGTYLIAIADPQLGKKGTSEAVDNWKRGVAAHLTAARALHEAFPLEGAHVAFMGDETENVCNSYGNQPHTIELNRSAQLELDFDLRVWTLKEAARLGVPLSVSSVISNHGEWTRNGSKEPVTSQGDNASTHIARQVKKLFDELADHGAMPRVTWHIGGGDPAVTLPLSGVDCYFSHGYIEKGKGGSSEIRTRNAIERQILGRTEELGKTSLFVTAHYHHFYSQEFEGRTLFGCPALEAERSSEYMLNQFGVWSPPGMLGMLVGLNHDRGWSNLNVF